MIEKISNYPLTIVRYENNGWSPAGKNADKTETLMFNINIDSVDDKYRLSCVSCDKKLDDDSIHKTIKDLKDYAKEIFGINYEKWSNT